MKFIYVLKTEINYAETWRDEDNIETNIIGIYDNLDKAIKEGNKIYYKHASFYQKDNPVLLNKKRRVTY